MQRVPCYTAFVAHLINCALSQRLNCFCVLIQFPDRNQWLRFSLKALLPSAHCDYFFRQLLIITWKTSRTSLEILLSLRLLMRHYTIDQKQSSWIRFVDALTVIFGLVLLAVSKVTAVRTLSGAHCWAQSQRRVESDGSALEITFHLHLDDKGFCRCNWKN